MDTPFIVLWLILLTLTGVSGVCTSCWGADSDCPGNRANCPWITGVVANTAALAAGGAATLTVGRMLPTKVARLFPRAVLDILLTTYRSPKVVVSADVSTLKVGEFYKSVLSGVCSRFEALTELAGRMVSVSWTPDATGSIKAAEAQFKGLEAASSVIKSMPENPAFASNSDGAYLYVLARLSRVICTDKDQPFDLTVEVNDPTTTVSEGEASSSTSASVRTFSSSLHRPRSYAQAVALLNMFVLVLVTLGLATTSALGPFLDDCVYEPVRTNELEWPVAFEMLILYLRRIENSPEMYHVTDVIGKIGGEDRHGKVARRVAEGLYPKNCFRIARGEPRGHDDGSKNSNGGDGGDFKGEIKGYNHKATLGCTAYNRGNTHKAKHVKNGVCKYFHGCDQWVTDKGPRGQCLATDHKRDDCTYDSSKKCSQPVEA